MTRRRPVPGHTLTRQHVAEMLGCADARATDRLVKSDPTFPRPFFPFVRSPRWRHVDVQEWIDRRAEAAQMERAS